ncbi:MAG: sugar phosphate nucleotidyltransferase [Kiritimatiellia bacterium]
MKQKFPRKAVLLAAGFGTRLLPLTRIRPKALLPLGGRPMLEHSLRLLASWGVDDVLVNCHWLADQVMDYLRQVRLPGMKITISYEPEILGTGGVLRRADWFIGGEPFWMLNADVAADLNPAPLVRLFAKMNPLAVLWLHPERGPRTVEMRNSKITTFSSDRPGTPGTFTFCGLQMLSPDIMDYLPPPGFSSIITAYRNGMKAGRSVLGAAVQDSWWADIGSPESYLDAEREFRAAHRRRAGCDPRLRNSIILDGAEVGPGANLENAIVAPGCKINGSASGLIVPASSVLEPAEAAQVADIGNTAAEILPGRGSGRAFIRLHCGRKTAILIRYTYERAENRRYIRHAELLRAAGVNVPEIYFHSDRRAFTLMEDLGTQSLLEMGKDGRSVASAYHKVLDQVLLFHEKGRDEVRRRHHALEAPFDKDLYAWEHNLFCEKYLKDFLHLDATSIRKIRKELLGVSSALLPLRRVLLHRDLQSSNVFLKRGKPVFIDFQGMRMGPAVYDLASLLCDPYVMLEEKVQMDLLDDYRRRAESPAEPELFWLAAVQRLCQALGAYARLGALPQSQRFLENIPPARVMLARALRHTPRLTALKMLVSR